MLDLNLAQRFAVWLLPVIFAITVHEVAHGWMARRLGDPTALMLGRLTLNPIKHIDPVGTLLVPGLMLLFTPFVFGWAKPVPVTWQNLRQPKRDMVLVAAAGPAANLGMGLIWAALAKLALTVYPAGSQAMLFLLYAAAAGIFINAIVMVVNLLPLPPLDGGRVLAGLLPGPLAYRLGRIEPYGFLILIALLVTGLLGALLGPFIDAVQALLSGLAGLQEGTFLRLLYDLFGH